MKLSDISKKKIVVKKIPDGYTGGMAWAVVELGALEDFVIESGFRTKRDALEWLNGWLSKK